MCDKMLFLKSGSFVLSFLLKTIPMFFKRLCNPVRLCKPVRVSQRVRHDLNQLDSFNYTTVRDLNYFLISTILKGSLKKIGPAFTKLNLQCRRRICFRVRLGLRNCAVQVDKSFIYVLHGKRESQLEFARTRASLYARFGTLGFLMDLDSAREKKLHLLVTGNWYLLASCD